MSEVFPVLCAWCTDEVTILGTAEVADSHGICPKHVREMNVQIEMFKADLELEQNGQDGELA